MDTDSRRISRPPEYDISEQLRIDPPTRIRRAIYLRDLTLLKRIIKSNPQCLRNPDLLDHGNTSLHLAAKLGFLEITEFLIIAGHDRHQVSCNANAETPLHLAIANSADKAQGAAIAILLASKFPKCIPWKDRNGLDAIMLASRTTPRSNPNSSDHADLLSTLLTLHPHPLPLPLEATDHAGNTPLHHASAWGNLKAIRTLLEIGADPAARNERSWTPIAYSASVQAEVYFRGLVKPQPMLPPVSGGSAGAGPGARERGGSGGRREMRSGSIGEVVAGGTGVGPGSPITSSRTRGGSGGKIGVRIVRAESLGNEGVTTIEGLPKPDGRLRQAIIEAEQEWAQNEKKSNEF